MCWWIFHKWLTFGWCRICEECGRAQWNIWGYWSNCSFSVFKREYIMYLEEKDEKEEDRKESIKWLEGIKK